MKTMVDEGRGLCLSLSLSLTCFAVAAIQEDTPWIVSAVFEGMSCWLFLEMMMIEIYSNEHIQLEGVTNKVAGSFTCASIGKRVLRLLSFTDSPPIPFPVYGWLKISVRLCLWLYNECVSQWVRVSPTLTWREQGRHPMTIWETSAAAEERVSCCITGISGNQVRN